MSRIRGRGNRDTELRMISLFRAARIPGWRRQAKIFGKPDFVFPKERLAVFVDGCFWHRHSGCKFNYTPKTRLDFWLSKFAKTKTRDQIVNRTLKQSGWRVLRIWECELHQKYWPKIARRIVRLLKGE
jgi:DNA mismatch endonuclease, patch repair protein